jgi:hypothetical protein
MSMREPEEANPQRAGGEEEIVLFWTVTDSACDECGAEMARGAFLRTDDSKALCLECADLGHLVFLPRGDTALTRRSRKHSTLSAVVVRFSRARKRYERQGVLVEPRALERAEQECLGDEAARAAARQRAAEQRERADAQYVEQFAGEAHRQFPGCTVAEAREIAQHACRKHSGRVGRTAGAKALNQEMVELAVRAHVRHVHTRYDQLLNRGWQRDEARREVGEKVDEILDRWRGC